jgi:hypothetical protein
MGEVQRPLADRGAATRITGVVRTRARLVVLTQVTGEVPQSASMHLARTRPDAPAAARGARVARACRRHANPAWSAHRIDMRRANAALEPRSNFPRSFIRIM